MYKRHVQAELAVFVQQALIHIAGHDFGQEQVMACLLYTSKAVQHPGADEPVVGVVEHDIRTKGIHQVVDCLLYTSRCV